MTTTPASRSQRSRFRKALARILETSEVKLILKILRAENHGQTFRAGQLGLAQSLIRRGWLERDSAGNVSLTDATRNILTDDGAKT